MPIEGEILTRIWDPLLIALSYFVSTFGCLATISLAEEYRWYKQTERLKTTERIILVLASVCFGGIAIWAMHWIAIAAVQLKTSQSEIISMRIDFVKSVFCCLFSIFCVCLGLFTASQDKFFALAKTDRIEMLVHEISATSTLQQIQNTGASRIQFVALIEDIRWIISGGIITGSGVCAMHYFEMLGMPMNVKILWNGTAVFASCVVAIVGAVFAYWIVFRLLTWKPEKELFRIGSAVLLSLSVSGMHYTAEFAAHYTFSSSFSSPSFCSEKMNWLAVSGLAELFSFAMLYFAYYSQRTRCNILFKSHEEIEKALATVQTEMNDGISSGEVSSQMLSKLITLTESSLGKTRAYLGKPAMAIVRATENKTWDTKHQIFAPQGLPLLGKLEESGNESSVNNTSSSFPRTKQAKICPTAEKLSNV